MPMSEFINLQLVLVGRCLNLLTEPEQLFSPFSSIYDHLR